MYLECILSPSPISHSRSSTTQAAGSLPPSYQSRDDMLVKTDVVAANSPEEVALASDLEPIHLGRRCGLGGGG